MSSTPVVYLLGASDTKSVEINFLRNEIKQNGCQCFFVDTRITSSLDYPPGSDQKAYLMEQKAIEIRDHLRACCSAPSAFLGIGGGVGSWIALAVMRNLPLGVGKVLVSTLPFDPRSELGASDVILIPSIVDIQGLNPILRMVLRRAARIACDLAPRSDLEASNRPLVAITGLGITTPAVKHCQEMLEEHGFEVATFHATGFGSCAYEQLIESGAFRGVIDLTTHELNGALFGGVAIPESNRLTTAKRLGVPQVVCPGGLDILGRGPCSTLTEEERKRPHYQHSPMFTHLRANTTEMRRSALLMAERLSGARGPCAVMIPLGGFSQADQPNSQMWLPEANAAFLETLRQNLPESIELSEYDDHINSQSFCRAVVSKLLFYLKQKGNSMKLTKNQEQKLELDELKADLIEVALRAARSNLQTNTGGNLSARLKTLEAIIIKPSGIGFAETNSENLMLVSLAGTILEGSLKPSKDLEFHLEIYRLRPEVRAIVHCHSPWATGWACANSEVPCLTVHSRAKLRRIPLVPVAPDGGPQTEREVREVFSDPEVNAAVFQNHGACGVGSTLRDALHIAQLIEETAHIAAVHRIITAEH